MPIWIEDLRKKYKVQDTVKGVVILGVDANSPAADKRLTPGDVIVEIAQEAVANADDFQAKIDKLKKEGRRTALLLGGRQRWPAPLRGTEFAVILPLSCPRKRA